MLGDEVASAGVQGAGEEGGEDQVDERFRTKGSNEEIVEEELGDDVKEMQGG